MARLFDGVASVHPSLQPPGIQAKQGGGTAIPAFTLSIRSESALRTLQSAWSETDGVRYVERNALASVDGLSHRNSLLSPVAQSAPDEPVSNAFADSLDHLAVVRARDAWGVTRGTPDVRIGILDTGIYWAHPDLRSSLWVNSAEDLNGNGMFDPGDVNGVDDDGNGYVDDVVGYDFVDRPGVPVPGEFTDRDPDPSPDSLNAGSPHGTAVAGVATARARNPQRGAYGVAPNTRFVAIRTFAGDGRGATDDIAAGIIYAADTGIDVLNMSFGRSVESPLIREAVRYAHRNGVVLVGSAGNRSTDDPHYPSDYPEVISVGWFAEDGDGLPPQSFSTYGIGVDMGAPGARVYTTLYPRIPLRDGEPVEEGDLYGPLSGSSFSAPQVAGAAALLRTLDRNLTPDAILSILTRTAEDVGAEGWDHLTGAGLLNAFAAVTQVLPGETTLQAPAHNAGVPGTAPVPIVATALDPAFQSVSIFYAEGTQNLDQRLDPWIEIHPPTEQQILRDTLALWDVTTLQEGEYTLRLVTTLTDGSTVEDRRRVTVDGTPPEISVVEARAVLAGESFAAVADIRTNDETRLRNTVRLGGSSETYPSEFWARRHTVGLTDDIGTGGTAELVVEATNRSGLTSTEIVTVEVPASEINPAYLTESETTLPVGRLYTQPVFFDDDGLPEVLMSPFDGGGIGDSLKTFEWTPDGFVPSDSAAISGIPRDVQDATGNGRTNLLVQREGITRVLEAPPEGGFPTEELFFSDTDLQSPAADTALFGALLTDLDDDGRGEVVGHNRLTWRILEWDGSEFAEVTTLGNPTSFPARDTVNTFQAALAAEGDFDADGRADVLVGDADGDWIIYENDGPDRMRVAWTYETDRFGGGERFGVGDTDGDGNEEFITFARFDPEADTTGNREAPIGTYYFWDSDGNDRYRLVQTIGVFGEVDIRGALETADVDGDGREEVYAAHPPRLYLFDYEPSADRWTPRTIEQPRRPVQSRSLIAQDFDGNGVPEVLVGSGLDQLLSYSPNASALGNPPPTWVRAVPLGPDASRLVWRAPSADSVTVYAGAPGADLDPLQTLVDSTVTLSGPDTRRYALRAWRSESPSPFADARTVRPHAPATVADVAYPDPQTVRVTFTEPLASGLRAEQFTLGGDALVNEVLLANQQRSLLLRIDAPPAGPATLAWTGVVDADRLPVEQTSVSVTFPDVQRGTLIVNGAEITGPTTVRLTFSEPVTAESAETPSNYTLRPSAGSVQTVERDDDLPAQVTLEVAGIVLGATGLDASVRVRDVEAESGARLAENSGAVSLSQPADALDEVFVYPNPYRSAQHSEGVTIAGLPVEAVIRIYTPEGRHVRTLEGERISNGGRAWDLRDARGRAVPSGIYFIRVEAPGNPPVMVKAAVLR